MGFGNYYSEKLDKITDNWYTVRELQVIEMKEIFSVLGVALKYLPQESAGLMIEEYLNNDVLNTMCVVTRDMLLYAGDHPEYRKALEEMDIHVMGDKDIFTAAGITEEALLKRAGDQEIWNLFINTVAREKKTCFLLAQTEDALEELKKNLENKCPELLFAGTYAADNAEGDPEIIVNEINSLLPDVIISAMAQPEQEMFICEQYKKLGATVWFGLPMMGSWTGSGESWLSRLIGRTVFNRRVQKYKSMQEDDWLDEEDFEEELVE